MKLYILPEFYIVTNLIGNYVIGCIFGFAIANLIQRIREENMIMLQTTNQLMEY